MNGGRDPVERAAGDRDLHEVATWEPRSRLDRVVHRIYEGILPAARGVLVTVAVAATLVILLVATYDTPNLPIVGLFVLASVVPALALAAYVYGIDVTTQEPPTLIVATFALSFVFASFAAVVNTAAESVFFGFGAFGVAAFYLFVVAPGEEFVKLLAVRFYAYRDGRFDAVVDGAVYGAVAGLGFATIENAIYVSGFVQTSASGTVVEQAITIAQQRALAGPGHVIYSAIAGYYLGLAKFNGRFSGALALKGITVAALLHAVYNVSVNIAPGVVAAAFDLEAIVAFVVYVAAFDGVAGGYLFLKLQRYRRAYEAVDAGADEPTGPVGRAGLDPETQAAPIGADGDARDADTRDADARDADTRDVDGDASRRAVDRSDPQRTSGRDSPRTGGGRTSDADDERFEERR